MKKKKQFDGVFRIYDLVTDSCVAQFSLRSYPTASSLEKVRMSIEPNLGQYVTLEYRMYEVEVDE